MWHDSEVAAVAYAIEQILERRSNASVANVLAEAAAASRVQQAASQPSSALPGVMAGKKCPECGAHAMIKKDGCEYCTSCGHLGTCG
jgi:ribonucleoside-diphosphate reductase alpha chain